MSKVGLKANLSVQAGFVTAFACDEIRRKHELPARNFAFDNLPHGQRLEYIKLNDFGITVQDVLIPIVIFSASGGLTDLYNLGTSIAKSIYNRTCSYFA
ncbi:MULTISPECIES: hypothetical protein [unclassified Endozoicomonas]|uniref:hypothetical protein n=1 Tax=unclassified Endozoicomonas TaxID=2644528 RepID=UPI003BB622AE